MGLQLCVLTDQIWRWREHGCHVLLQSGSLRSPFTATASVPELGHPGPNGGPPRSSPSPISVNDPHLWAPFHSECYFSLVNHQTLANVFVILLKPSHFSSSPQFPPWPQITINSCLNDYDSPSRVWLQFALFLTLLHTAARMIFPKHESILVSTLLTPWNGLPSPTYRRRVQNPSHGSQGPEQEPANLAPLSPAQPPAFRLHPTLAPLTFLECHMLCLISHSCSLPLFPSLRNSKSYTKICSGVTLFSKFFPYSHLSRSCTLSLMALIPLDYNRHLLVCLLFWAIGLISASFLVHQNFSLPWTVLCTCDQ